MSDHVIIAGVRRGGSLVSASEIKQMCGRCGRTHDGREYYADVVLSEDDAEMEAMLGDKESHVANSSMSSLETLAFHAVPYIVSGAIVDVDGIGAYYKKTLACSQGMAMDAGTVAEYLASNDAVRIDGERLVPLDNARLSSIYYFPVGDIKGIRDNFRRVISSDMDSDGAIAWALGNLGSLRVQADSGRISFLIDAFLDDLPVDYECGDVVTSALWWCMMGNGSAGGAMSGHIASLRRSIGRISRVLLDMGMDAPFIRVMEMRLKRGVSRDLIPFFKDASMTKSRAAHLKGMGYDGLDGIEEDDIGGEIA